MPVQLTCKACNALSQPHQHRGWRQLAVDGHGQFRLSRNGMALYRRAHSLPWLHDAWSCGPKCTAELVARFLHRGNFSSTRHSALAPDTAAQTFRPEARQRTFSPSIAPRRFTPEPNQVAA